MKKTIKPHRHPDEIRDASEPVAAARASTTTPITEDPLKFRPATKAKHTKSRPAPELQINRFTHTMHQSIPALAAILLAITSVMAGEPIRIEFAKHPGPKHRLMDDAASFIEIESYRIHTKRLVDFTPDRNKGTLTITNWIPRDLHELRVVRRAAGKDMPFLSLDILPGLASITLDVGGEALAGSPEFDFVPHDEVQREIKNITVEWDLSFYDRYMHNAEYREANVQWRPVRPQDARYLLTFMIHAAQTVSQPKFGEIWMKTPFRWWEKQGGKGRVKPGDRLTVEEFNTYPQDEKKHYDRKLIEQGFYYNKAHRRMVLGKYRVKKMRLGVTGGGGLGGGSTVGINHSRFIPLAWGWSEAAARVCGEGGICLPDGLGKEELRKTAWNIYGHECGHALGFGHNSTYCVMDQYSHITVGTLVHSWLAREKKLLVTSDLMVGRDEIWERPYVKFAPGPQLTRPQLHNAYEWAGPYGRHSFLFPRKGTPEWTRYLELHEQGVRGEARFEFIKQLPVNRMLARVEPKMTTRDWKAFDAAWKDDRALEFLQAVEQGRKGEPRAAPAAE